MIRTRRPRTLVWRVGLALMAVQATVAIVLGAFIYAHLRDYHARDIRAELQRAAALMTERYGAALRNGELARLQSVVVRDGAETGLRITVILPNGAVAADSESEPAQMDNHRYRPEVAEAMRNGAGSAVRYSNTVGFTMTYFATRLGSEETPIGVLRVAIPMTAVRAQLTDVVRTIAVAGGISLLVTLVATWLVSRGLATVVRRLAEGAQRFAAGDHSHRIPTPPTWELAALADALNDMADQVGEQIAQVRAQRNEQGAILRSMGNGVIAVDRRQRILNTNRAAARMFSLDEASARGRLLLEVIRQPALHQFVEASFEGSGDGRQEITLHGAATRIIEVRSEPLLNAQDQPYGLVLVFNDVTELRRLESIRSEFAANVSHELRTPITNIKGYVETLQDVGPRDEEQVRRFLAIIKGNADRLAAIIEDLLALARLETPGVREALEPEPTPASRVVAAVLEQLESAAEAKGIYIEVDVPPQVSVMAAPRLIEQALANLLSNAIKYSPHGGIVQLRAVESGDMVSLEVSDAGPGIPAEHLPRLFERFYRVDKARSREMGGTGLGLAIVKHIAIAHGGRISVESEVRKGSTFRLQIPRAATEAA